MTKTTKGFGKVEVAKDVKVKEMTIAGYKKVVAELEEALCYVSGKIGSQKKFKKTRKEMVMDIIKDGKEYSIGEIAEKVSYLAGVMITNKNISSQLTYLRDDLAKEGKYDIVRVGRGHGKLKLINI